MTSNHTLINFLTYILINNYYYNKAVIHWHLTVEVQT